jgi:hypothetical protein
MVARDSRSVQQPLSSLALLGMQLWEQCNAEVHGKTTEQQETTRKIKLSIDAIKLNILKDKARPFDMGLFHTDIEGFLDNSTAQTIATYISSHRKAIANSVKKYTAASQAGVTPVVQWNRGDGAIMTT